MYNWRNLRIPYLTKRSTVTAVVLLALLVAVVVSASSHIEDINPDASDNSNANASSGGRVNGLSADANNNQIFYAASEYGGLFKTTDAGSNWSRLDNHVPAVTWDVAVDPGNSNRVVATSWFDGRVFPDTLSGIEVSTDAGSNWTRPATARPNDPADEGTGSDNTPQPGYSCSEARRTEPSAFGIGFRPDATANIYVGTNCGVAISNDSGATWSFVDPTPGDSADDVWDVVVQAGGANGIVDICGDDGHLRSTDGGTTWTQAGADPFSSGRCSIAASPDESYVLFVIAVDNNVYESDDAGATWTNLGNRNAQGRIPFVVTNQRSDDGDTDRFNLWYSDTQLFRADCTTPDPPVLGGANRCPTSASWTNYQTGAHWDAGDLEFDTAVSVDACPMIYSTDGGVHTNTVGGSGCHAPTWQRSNVGLHALWAWAMDGADQAGDTGEDLLFGTQDNGTFAATNGGASPPTWTNPRCCDTFDTLADPAWQLGTTCCFGSGRFNRLELADPGYAGAAEINQYPTGTIPGFTFATRLAQFDSNSVALITSTGLNITTNINASPIVWTNLSQPAGSNPCGVWAADDGGTPIFYIQSGQCTGAGNDQVWFYTGTTAGGSWTRIDNNDGRSGGFGVSRVDGLEKRLDGGAHGRATSPVSGPEQDVLAHALLG